MSEAAARTSAACRVRRALVLLRSTVQLPSLDRRSAPLARRSAPASIQSIRERRNNCIRARQDCARAYFCSSQNIPDRALDRRETTRCKTPPPSVGLLPHSNSFKDCISQYRSLNVYSEPVTSQQVAERISERQGLILDSLAAEFRRLRKRNSLPKRCSTIRCW